MKKLRLILLSIVLLGFMIGCHKVDMTNTDKERIEFVKDTILRYGMEIVTEVTQDTLEENNKSTDDIVSFGKKQIYELSCDLDTNSLFYHKFESSKGGKEEAEKLFSELRDSIIVLPDSTIEEKTDTETGNKSFTSRSKLTNSTETIDTLEDDDIANDKALYAEILIVLIYDAAKYEVAVMTSQVKSPSDSIDTMINIEMMDMEWTY
jgi:hypothetical protein